jgi:hypothetical protein
MATTTDAAVARVTVVQRVNPRVMRASMDAAVARVGAMVPRAAMRIAVVAVVRRVLRVTER